LEPTYQPTCTPQQEYSDELMDEYCSVEDTAFTYKHYNGVLDESGTAVDRAPIACTDLNGAESGEQDTLDLQKSLANKLWEDCSSWCVFDWYTEAVEVWKWSDGNKCWTKMTKGSCIYDYTAKEYLPVWYEMQDKVLDVCTLSPTLSPTSCYPEYEWSQERADEVCDPAGYGSTDRSFGGAVVCTDSNSAGKQAQLEKTLANEFYAKCDSWCIYDWETLVNDIDGLGGFIWRSEGCWKWVTKYSCFEANADQQLEVRAKAMETCAYQATLWISFRISSNSSNILKPTRSNTTAKLPMGSIAARFIFHPEYIIILGIFMLCCALILFGIKLKSRRRALKIATNVGIITNGGLNNDCSDIDLFDEDYQELLM